MKMAMITAFVPYLKTRCNGVWQDNPNLKSTFRFCRQYTKEDCTSDEKIFVDGTTGCRAPENKEDCKEHYPNRPIFKNGKCHSAIAEVTASECKDDQILSNGTCIDIEDDSGCVTKFGSDEPFFYDKTCNKFQNASHLLAN